MGQTPVVGFFKRLWSHFPFHKEADSKKASSGGFGVRITVPAKAVSFGPVVSQCTYGSGGVQGLRWYSEKLCSDEDGDVAEEFLCEAVKLKALGKISLGLEATLQTIPVKLKGPVGTCDGNVYQLVEAWDEVQRA